MIQVKRYKLKLLDKKLIAKDTYAFRWIKPRDFVFTAGQTLDWTVLNSEYTDPNGDTRTFSIAASPYENHLMFVTRMRNTPFKKALARLKTGDTIIAAGPFNSFTYEARPKKRAVFLTGGIGITPVVSIVNQAVKDGLDSPILLFSANKTASDAIFLEEFENLSKKTSYFTFVPTMTGSEIWTGEKGRISIEMIARYTKSLDDSTFYISGPMPMVASLGRMLAKAGVKKSDIRTEDFPGY